jgi:hypothetical protein
MREHNPLCNNRKEYYSGIPRIKKEDASKKIYWNSCPEQRCSSSREIIVGLLTIFLGFQNIE